MESVKFFSPVKACRYLIENRHAPTTRDYLMQSGASIVSASGLVSVYYNSQVYQFDKGRKDYDELLGFVDNEQWDQVVDRLDANKLKQAVNQKFDGTGVAVEGNAVTFNGQAVHNTVCDRIVEATENGRSPLNLVNFLVNLQANPSFKSAENLYRFLEYNNHPITKDGYFIAYKRVRDDFTDCHTGKFDNSVGKVVEMPRNKVEDDPNKTCSAGLHVAALEYARNFYSGGNGRLVVVKVSPADVVSVPTDYQNQKLRCCRYEVLEEMKDQYKPWDQDYIDDLEDEMSQENLYDVEGCDDPECDVCR